MARRPKIIEVRFYASASDAEPVRDWLKEMDPADRRAIATVEHGWPIGMPTCRPLGEGLWEVRTSLEGGRIARVIFAILEGRMVLLHGFMKTTQKTPKVDLDMARKRKKEIER
ncbi:type II toxin-antitoxin system RelE/ParE family toxin [Emcibacter sp. SYSU 3D8]